MQCLEISGSQFAEAANGAPTARHSPKTFTNTSGRGSQFESSLVHVRASGGGFPGSEYRRNFCRPERLLADRQRALIERPLSGEVALVARAGAAGGRATLPSERAGGRQARRRQLCGSIFRLA